MSHSMSNAPSLLSRFASAWRLMRGLPSLDKGELGVRVAALELDLREREAEIERVRAEYRRLGQQAEQERDAAAMGGVAALARRLVSPLSQLATMAALAEAGRELRVGDVLKLCGRVDAVLAEDGLTRIGTVGEEVPFDSRHHQRLSGADLDEGAPVRVRFVGYRLGETILLKAMVSRADAAVQPGAASTDEI